MREIIAKTTILVYRYDSQIEFAEHLFELTKDGWELEGYYEEDCQAQYYKHEDYRVGGET